MATAFSPAVCVLFSGFRSEGHICITISSRLRAYYNNFLTFDNKVSPGGDMFFLTGTQVPQVRGTCGHTGPQVRGSSEERPTHYYGNIT